VPVIVACGSIPTMRPALRALRRAAPIALLAGCLAATAHAAEPKSLEGRVVGIADGDTVTVLDASKAQHRMRLAGIDAPERGQPGGLRSKESLAAIVFDQPVRVQWHKRDPYGRLVGTLWVAPQEAECRGRPECPTTLDAGLAQLTLGRAWWFRRYADEQPPDERERYESAEAHARERKLGLWRDGVAVPPWEWRERTRSRP